MKPLFHYCATHGLNHSLSCPVCTGKRYRIEVVVGALVVGFVAGVLLTLLS